MIGIPLLLMLTLPAEEPVKPRFPLGKETTFVTGQLNKDGYVDYTAALNERLGKGVTPENNANVLIWKALGPRPEGVRLSLEYFKTLGINEPPERGDYFIGLRQFVKDRLKQEPADWEAVFAEQSRAAKRPWTAKEHPRIADWLAANENPLALIVEGTKRAAYFNPLIPNRTEKEPGLLIGALLPAAQKCREVALALAVRSMLRTGEGQSDEAWQDLLACHRLAWHIGGGAMNIEALIGIALNATACSADLAYIDNARLTSAQIQDRLKDLERLPPMPAIADKMDVGERLICLDALEGIHRDMFAEMVGKTGTKPDPQAVKAMESIDFAPTLRKANQIYDRLAAAMRIGNRAKRMGELEKISNEFEEEAAANNKMNASLLGRIIQAGEIFAKPEDVGKKVGKSIGDAALGLMMPAAVKVQNSYDRCAQMQRIVEIAFALAAYRSDTGHYPAKLDDLTPKHIATVPGDLFSGKPLIYRPIADGYVLYSVGLNCTDDGGRFYDSDPPGDDIGVRMPLSPLTKARPSQ
jgi:hypothetical protein